MWKKLQDSPPFYIAFNEDNGLEIIITDYISVWSLNFTRETFLSRLKDCNKKFLEFENDEELFQQGLTMLSEPEKLKELRVVQEDEGKTLSVSMDMLFGYLLTIEYKLTKGTEVFFYEKVTKKLLQIIQDLQSSQKKLRGMVKQKDIVIAACKKKGVELNRRRLRNVVYNDEDHLNTHKQYEATFGSNEAVEDVLNKITASLEKESADAKANVKIEPGSIKTEPKTPTNDTANNLSAACRGIKLENMKSEPSRLSCVRKRPKKLSI